MPLSEQTAIWKREGPSEELLAREEVLNLLEPVRRGWLLVSASHDNYTRIPGGIQVCVLREERLTRDAGGHYLNIHPVQPLPCLAAENDEDTAVVLVLDGKVAAGCRMSDLIAAIEDLVEAGTRVSLSIHQLLGHNPEQVAQLGTHIDFKNIVVWLHDYFTICPGVRLQRNNLAFCGAPDVASNACRICAYGKERVSHVRRMKKLFATLAPTILSPSSFAQDLWLTSSAFRTKKIVTVPHLTLTWEPRAQPLKPTAFGRIRIGFLGTPVRHKGWPVFEHLSHDPAFQARFEFIVFYASDTRTEGRKVEVRITADNPDAMARAVAAEEIDLVLHWPEWPETFALTAYEALEGGAWLVTNAGSGNVASTVEQLGRGVVLPDEDALTEFLSGDDVEKMVANLREERAAFAVNAVKSRLSLSVLEGVR